VESVRFNNDEDTVIAGSLSGALKLWDLESVKSKNYASDLTSYSILRVL